METKASGCTRPAVAVENKTETLQNMVEKEKTMETAKVGYKAPDFEAPAYYKGGFTTVKLSSFIGKWVVLCFYPGDFTFV